MKRLRSHELSSVEDIMSLERTPSTELVIGLSESPRARIKRIMSDNPVIIFSRPSCCMCLVMRSLLSAVGAKPDVIELEDSDVSVAAKVCGRKFALPSLCIGDACVGGLDVMMELHLRNDLVPRLHEVGALKKREKKLVN